CLNIFAMPGESASKILIKRFGHPLSALQQISHPKPRKTSKRDLKAAAPIDTNRVRIRLLPGIKLPCDFLRVSFIAVELPCFRYRDMVLLAIQFPRNLVVADFVEVEKSNFVPRLKRSTFAVDGIEVPVDLLAIVEIAITEQTEPMLQDFVRLINRVFN